MPKTVTALYRKIPMISNFRPIKNLRLEIARMKKWQESRNYRRLKDENGNIIANIITVDGEDVEVSEEVFLAYSQADRRERYVFEEAESGKLISLDKLIEDGVPLENFGIHPESSAEYITLKKEALIVSKECMSILVDALANLREADRGLINALYFKGLSTREYASQIGTTQRAVIKRRDRILRDLRKNFEKFSF